MEITYEMKNLDLCVKFSREGYEQFVILCGIFTHEFEDAVLKLAEKIKQDRHIIEFPDNNKLESNAIAGLIDIIKKQMELINKLTVTKYYVPSGTTQYT